MDNLQLVIFDMDGLLFDTEMIYYRATKKAAEEIGLDLPFENYKKLIGITDEETKEILREMYGQDSPIPKIMDTYRPWFEKIIAEEGIVVKPGVEKLLNVLDEKGIKKCIASSSMRPVIERNVKLAGLNGRFDFYISGTEVENGKPYPDIFLACIERADVAADEALVLEDSYNGLLASHRANIPCIIVPDLIEPTDEMKELAFRICDDLGEVADLIKNT